VVLGGRVGILGIESVLFGARSLAATGTSLNLIADFGALKTGCNQPTNGHQTFLGIPMLGLDAGKAPRTEGGQ